MRPLSNLDTSSSQQASGHFPEAASRIRAIGCLAALALGCLALSPNPPPDPIWSRWSRLAGRILGVSLSGVVLGILTLGLVILGTLAVTSIRDALRRKRKPEETWVYPEPPRGKGALTLVLLGMVIATFLAFRGIAWWKAWTPSAGGRVPAPAPTAQAVPASPPQAPVLHAAPALVPLGVGSALILALLGLGIAYRAMRRPRGAQTGQSRSVPLAAARRRLELGDPARDAIIGCYAEMCRLFEPRNRHAAPGLTAREFAALLRSQGAQEPEILALTGVFEKARYSQEPCGEPDRALARDALAEIETRYAGPCGQGGGPP